MTDKYFFDTDCLSAFLWVRNENLLVKLYAGKIILPEQVYSELSHPRTPHLKKLTDALKNNGDILIESIEMDTEEYKIYCKLIINPDKGFKIIGKGEAAAIALAKTKGGILASNNMKDIQQYVEEYGLEHITTGDILIEALNKQYITENEGNIIWANMIAKNIKLPNNTFSEFMQIKKDSLK